MSTRDENWEAVVLRICVSDAGWTVIESYNRRSAADFAVRDDAVEYAISVAKSRTPAVVEVYSRAGFLEARSNYTGTATGPDQECGTSAGTAR